MFDEASPHAYERGIMGFKPLVLGWGAKPLTLNRWSSVGVQVLGLGRGASAGPQSGCKCWSSVGVRVLVLGRGASAGPRSGCFNAAMYAVSTNVSAAWSRTPSHLCCHPWLPSPPLRSSSSSASWRPPRRRPQHPPLRGSSSTRRRVWAKGGFMAGQHEGAVPTAA